MFACVIAFRCGRMKFKQGSLPKPWQVKIKSKMAMHVWFDHHHLTYLLTAASFGPFVSEKIPKSSFYMGCFRI